MKIQTNREKLVRLVTEKQPYLKYKQMKPGRQKNKQQQQKENPHTLTDYMIKNSLVNIEKRTVSLLF